MQNFKYKAEANPCNNCPNQFNCKLFKENAKAETKEICCRKFRQGALQPGLQSADWKPMHTMPLPYFAN